MAYFWCKMGKYPCFRPYFGPLQGYDLSEAKLGPDYNRSWPRLNTRLLNTFNSKGYSRLIQLIGLFLVLTSYPFQPNINGWYGVYLHFFHTFTQYILSIPLGMAFYTSPHGLWPWIDASIHPLSKVKPCFRAHLALFLPILLGLVLNSPCISAFG